MTNVIKNDSFCSGEAPLVKRAESTRFRPLDSARGIAMGLVCLAHFVLIYSQTSHVSLNKLFFYFTRIATPAFIVVSGTLLGLFSVVKKDRFDHIQKKYINRGIFLITIGHIVISLGHIFLAGNFIEANKFVYITDAIGFNCLVGPLLLRKLKTSTKIILSFCLFVTSWIIVIAWDPERTVFRIIKEVFWGDFEDSPLTVLHYTFSFLPWFSFFLVSAVIGERVWRRQLKNKSYVGLNFLIISILYISLSLGIKCLFLLSQKFHWMFTSILSSYPIIKFAQKSPPSIIFFLFYGGLGYMLIFGCIYCQKKNWLMPLFNIMDYLGRNSLFAFVVQFFVYYTVLALLDLPYSSFWPLYFLISILIVIAATVIWDRLGWTRHLTVNIFK